MSNGGLISGAFTSGGVSTLTKVTKSYSDIVDGTIALYTLPTANALVNVYTDITTVFDLSTAVTVGDSADENGFQQSANFTSGTGLTSATRGAYVTNWKGMRSTSGTTAISAYNFTGGGDSMGAAADGTINGATFSEVDPPIGDGWLSFDGTNDYCTANGANTAMSTIGTVSVWFKFDTLAAPENDSRLWEFGDTNANEWLSVALNYPAGASAQLEITMYGGGQYNWSGSTGDGSIVAGNWYHLVITHNATTPTFWLGELGEAITDVTNLAITTDETVWITSPIDNFNIGRQDHNNTTTNYLDGGIAELAMWNVVLSEAQINVLHDNNDSTPQPASTYPTNLRVYFPFNVDGVMTNAAPVTYDTQGAVDFYLQVVSE